MTNTNAKEAILMAAKRAAQARGYGGLNFRDIAQEVGIKAASIHYYFPNKADLGAAVAKRYWEDTAALLETLANESGDPLESLRRYPDVFRVALANENRMCLASFMTAEYDALPQAVKAEILVFGEVNVTWLCQQLCAALPIGVDEAHPRACAIFAALTGAQLMARGRADIALFDLLVSSYRLSGPLPV